MAIRCHTHLLAASHLSLARLQPPLPLLQCVPTLSLPHCPSSTTPSCVLSQKIDYGRTFPLRHQLPVTTLPRVFRDATRFLLCTIESRAILLQSTTQTASPTPPRIFISLAGSLAHHRRRLLSVSAQERRIRTWSPRAAASAQPPKINNTHTAKPC